MDNPGQRLYGDAKPLILQGNRCAASFLGTRLPTGLWLSLAPLDNHVDNSGQALYGSAKSLILNAYRSTAFF